MVAGLTMTGYSTFARLIAQHPECAIFRAFNAGNAKRLLFLQAELCWLEREHDRVVSQDKTTNRRSRFEKSWAALSQARGEDAVQYEISRIFFDKLNEYC